MPHLLILLSLFQKRGKSNCINMNAISLISEQITCYVQVPTSRLSLVPWALKGRTWQGSLLLGSSSSGCSLNHEFQNSLSQAQSLFKFVLPTFSCKKHFLEDVNWCKWTQIFTIDVPRTGTKSKISWLIIIHTDTHN